MYINSRSLSSSPPATEDCAHCGEKMQRSNGEDGIAEINARKAYRGVRRRKWGKWVSEIRLPASRDRLWLGSYSTAEAAAVAHDTAVFCLRGPAAVSCLNFPGNVPPYLRLDMSPKAVRRAAAEAGMAVDKELMSKRQQEIGHGRGAGRSQSYSSRVEDVGRRRSLVLQRTGAELPAE